MIAVDTNILVYAHREDSPHHARAGEALRRLATGRAPWVVPWPCLHEFLAITTHPHIYHPPSSPELAVSAVETLLDAPSASAIGEAHDHAAILARLLGNSIIGPRVHDARIAAICLGHGVTELWSADRDFSYFPDLRTRNPLVRCE